ncbi:MAG TPA: cation acetate symporter [Candidatus Sphingobacterium stercoripullorum]|uniref:Cation acetate symporter n=1 Tax=Candidatus Sphingobacterium stercoripullorum TaxID=2838759 RepID=A0A9D1WA46_9SPHI|nr:cation acetate symporter [Candidatus Sphingobacterium stercoripullorum]HLR49858.1 cation acetate symporter [Candidatus Sphingobacterium stercoripullorum]
MIYSLSWPALLCFLLFAGIVIWLSFYFARKTNSSSSYYAAGGKIHWGVNGIAFAGDYLSAASFLGICGMIAVSGFDGFLYAIGFLAGWIVALFLIAEPFKRLGKFTFTDALNARFNSRAITLSASVSTLIISIFYLIPQMVGAGDLVTPLLGLPHWMGVVIVGLIVILIVASAGMTSTTYVQFLKGGLLIVLSIVLTFYTLNNGLSASPDFENKQYHKFLTLEPSVENGTVKEVEGWEVLEQKEINGRTFVALEKNNVERWFESVLGNDKHLLKEALSVTHEADGQTLYNGLEKEAGEFFQVGHLEKILKDGLEVEKTGSLGPLSFIAAIQQSEIVRFNLEKFQHNGRQVSIYYQETTAGSDFLLPGLKYKIGKDANWWSKLDFISLMMALFLGTAALPHILIRYYTVKSSKDARKSTILAIAAIGAFYLLTLYMGLGAAVNGVLDVESSNMAAPLLAKAFGTFLFSLISAVAFATVLGTVAGLIVASSGAIAHDFIDVYLKKNLSDSGKVKTGKIAAFVVGAISILLGIAFKGMNVSFLVGWAFAIAASANLPAILFLLFWDKTSEKGISISIIVGIVSSLLIILTSPTMWDRYGFNASDAIHHLENPALISFPLAVLAVYVFSILFPKKKLEAVKG